MSRIEAKAEAYANATPIPFASDELTEVIQNAIKQAYLDGAKEGEYQAESRHADGHTVAYLKGLAEGRIDGKRMAYGEMNKTPQQINTMTNINGIIIDGKVYTAQMGHPDAFALCSMCDLAAYCEHTDREACAAISSPSDHFLYSQDLTDKLNKD